MVIADAPSVHETIAIARDLKPDAVIADLRIGDGNSEGVSVVATLISQLENTPVIVNSDHSSRSYNEKLTTAGATAVIAKSAACADELMDALDHDAESINSAA